MIIPSKHRGQRGVSNGMIGHSNSMINEMRNPTERYCLREKIGQGGYGYVYKAIDTTTGEIVAAKLINLDEAGDELECVQQEISVMSTSTCAQLTKYYASYLSGRSALIILLSSVTDLSLPL
jgi:serine/threonine protein kinase